MNQKANIHTSQLRASPLAKNIIQFLLGQRSYFIVNIHMNTLANAKATAKASSV